MSTAKIKLNVLQSKYCAELNIIIRTLQLGVKRKSLSSLFVDTGKPAGR